MSAVNLRYYFQDADSADQAMDSDIEHFHVELIGGSAADAPIGNVAEELTITYPSGQPGFAEFLIRAKDYAGNWSYPLGADPMLAPEEYRLYIDVTPTDQTAVSSTLSQLEPLEDGPVQTQSLHDVFAGISALDQSTPLAYTVSYMPPRAIVAAFPWRESQRTHRVVHQGR